MFTWYSTSMTTLSENRRARFDYMILERVDAGIELLGHEVKSVKAGKMTLAGSFGVVRGNEIYLIGANVPPYQAGNVPKDYDPMRSRRLLLKREEIVDLISKMKERGLTLVPLHVYTKGALVKIELGLCRGKRGPDKREAIRKRETKREVDRTLKKSF